MRNPLSALFFLLVLLSSPCLFATTINLFVAGTGGVGRELLSQIRAKHAAFKAEKQLDIRVVATANSQNVYYSVSGFGDSDSGYEFELHASANAGIVSVAISSHLPNKVFVDCTSSEELGTKYAQLLANGVSIVTASKKANSGPQWYYDLLRTISAQKGVQFIYDANAGGGLPFISTIQALHRAGEPISRIEGVFSGTLSFLFNNFKEGVLFSELLRQAQGKGFTEPDPRDDLNGLDVARKVVILAREAGHKLDLKDVVIEPYLPQSFFSAPKETLYTELAASDSHMADLQKAAARENKRLVYIASFADGKAKLALTAVDASHPFYYLSGCDNILSLTTPSYQSSPIVIRGPGAGNAVTAGRVLEGIVRIGLQTRNQDSCSAGGRY